MRGTQVEGTRRDPISDTTSIVNKDEHNRLVLMYFCPKGRGEWVEKVAMWHWQKTDERQTKRAHVDRATDKQETMRMAEYLFTGHRMTCHNESSALPDEGSVMDHGSSAMCWDRVTSRAEMVGVGVADFCQAQGSTQQQQRLPRGSVEPLRVIGRSCSFRNQCHGHRGFSCACRRQLTTFHSARDDGRR